MTRDYRAAGKQFQLDKWRRVIGRLWPRFVIQTAAESLKGPRVAQWGCSRDNTLRSSFNPEALANNIVADQEWTIRCNVHHILNYCGHLEDIWAESDSYIFHFCLAEPCSFRFYASSRWSMRCDEHKQLRATHNSECASCTAIKHTLYRLQHKCDA